ncbi:Olfactomedin-4, partial [Dissostichus eleginoides]
MWSFPAEEYKAALQQVTSCEESLNSLQDQVELSSERLPQIAAVIQNVTERLEPHRYLQDQGLYTDLAVHQLGQELSRLEGDIGDIHSQLNNAQTQKLSKEDRYCLKGMMSNISDPVTTKISPYGKTIISGSWGKQTQRDSEGQKNSFWVQPLLKPHLGQHCA